MSNSKKLSDDIRKHRGFYDVHPMNVMGMDKAVLRDYTVTCSIETRPTPNLDALIKSMTELLMQQQNDMFKNMFIGQCEPRLDRSVPLSFDPTVIHDPKKDIADILWWKHNMGIGFHNHCGEIPLGPPEECVEFTHHIQLNRPVEFIMTNISVDNLRVDCPHTNKRKEGISKLFWVCNDCKKDLGDV